MEKLRRQLFVKKMLFSAGVFLLILLFFRFGLEPLVMRQARRQLLAAYDIILEYENSPGKDEVSSEPEILTEISSTVSFLMMDKSFHILYGSAPVLDNEVAAAWFQNVRDTFTTDAEPVLYENLIGRPYAIRSRAGTDGEKYLYIFRYTNSIYRFKRNILRALLVLFPLLLVLEAAFFHFLLWKMLSPIERIRKGLDALNDGDYILRLTEQPAKNEIADIARSVNRLADILLRQQGTLYNYEYIVRHGARDGYLNNSLQKKLISNITHQLKTPLAIISSQVELAHSEPDKQKKDYYYNSIMEEIDKMSMLITDILYSSRKNQEYIQSRCRRILLSDLLKELTLKYENWLQAEGICFASRIEEGVYADADPIQIEQAVNNYMMNAYSHTHSGQLIRLSMTREEEGCRVTVYNEGAGVNEDEMDRIWMDYYQGDPDPGQARIGVGLYIVSDIMRQHSGSCGVVNVPGGVEFWIMLPRVD